MNSPDAALNGNPARSPQETLEFLRTLWPAGLPEGSLLTCANRARGFKGMQFQDLRAASKFLCAAPDRYFTVGATRKLEKGRGTANDIVAIPAFWHDFDTLAGEHAQTQLPGSNAEALAFIREDVPIQPSVVLDSGGGLQTFWLFAQVLLLDTNEDRQRAENLSDGWQETIIGLARDRGWIFDNTADLPRVMRAAGTLNGKYDPVRLVRVVEGFELRRHALADFERYEKESGQPRKRAQKKSCDSAAPGVGTCRFEIVLWRAAEMLGGGTKPVIDGGRITALVLDLCPACNGREIAGTVIRETAHISAFRLALRCKRESCSARGEGFSFDRWTLRFLDECRRAELSTLFASARASIQDLYTDSANADRFLNDHGQEVRYCDGLGGWTVWGGRRWEREGTEDEVTKRAKGTARIIVAHAGEISSPLLHVQSNAGIRSMLSLAKAEVSLPASAFDADPMLLNVANGTLDLRTGMLRPHKRGDLVTKLLPIVYDPSARCPDLEQFLDWFTWGQMETRRFLERWCGYSLTGDTSEQKFLLLSGPGNSGKTTFIETLASTLGGYAMAIPFEALLRHERKIAGPRPELARLKGARLATASEVADGAIFDAATVKSLTGGDTLAVRDMYGKTFDLKVTFKLMLAANRAPRIEPRDSAERRRLLVLPATHVIPVENTRFAARLREPDAQAALLAIAVRGCTEWQRSELGSCEAVELATTEYWDGVQAAKYEADVLTTFFAEHCQLDPEGWETSLAIADRLRLVIGRMQVAMPSLRRLGAFLRSQGCLPRRTAEERGWSGLRLRMDDGMTQ